MRQGANAKILPVRLCLFMRFPSHPFADIYNFSVFRFGRNTVFQELPDPGLYIITRPGIIYEYKILDYPDGFFLPRVALAGQLFRKILFKGADFLLKNIHVAQFIADDQFRHGDAEFQRGIRIPVTVVQVKPRKVPDGFVVILLVEPQHGKVQGDEHFIKGTGLQQLVGAEFFKKGYRFVFVKN